MKYFLFVFLLSTVLTGCYDCGPQKELTLDFSLDSKDTLFSIKRLYSRNEKGVIDLPVKIDIAGYRSNLSIVLPLSLHENQTTYFFEFENRLDSMTVFYERKYYYDKHCGFVADIDTSPGQAPRATSTFSFLEINSTSYVGGQQPVQFFSTGYFGGIVIRASI